MCDRSINTYMTYTITLSDEQKHIIVHALRKFSEYTLGQRADEAEAAKKLESMISKLNQYSRATDLTK